MIREYAPFYTSRCMAQLLPKPAKQRQFQCHSQYTPASSKPKHSFCLRTQSSPYFLRRHLTLGLCQLGLGGIIFFHFILIYLALGTMIYDNVRVPCKKIHSNIKASTRMSASPYRVLVSVSPPPSQTPPVFFPNPTDRLSYMSDLKCVSGYHEYF